MFEDFNQCFSQDNDRLWQFSRTDIEFYTLQIYIIFAF